MKLRQNLIFIIFLFAFLDLAAQKEIKLSSPDKSIVITFRLTESAPSYKISYKGKTLINYSTINFSFLEGGDFGSGLIKSKPVFKESDETYQLIVGKAKQVRNHYHEVLIPLEEKALLRRKINLVARAYDDAIAFRYEFPQQTKWTSYTLTEESTHFNLAGNPSVRTLFLPNYTTSHEGEYSVLPLSDVKSDTLMDMPTLFEFADGNYMAITEAALVDYAGMYLVKHDGVLTGILSPLPGQEKIKVKAIIPHRSPWRVMMISDHIGALIESNILTNLNEPCKISDVSWIKPGKTTFPWWNGNITPDTTFAPGNNFETNKYYIDFCAENGLQYHSVVEYGLHEWYVNDGANFYPGPNADVTKPVPGLDMQEICDYAKQKGVGIRVWVYWKALYPKLEEAFTQYEKWGLSGMMVDFMDRDDQEMVNIQMKILEAAARHKLHIQFHGAYKPTGIQRTYPNEFTREGTLNYEVNKWDKRVDPDHDINIIFTRMLAGSTDYHLGGFRAVPPSKFKVQYTRPLMMGTRCHMLAMYVVLENYLGMVCDYPDAYLGQPGFDFLKQVPTVWDETKVIDAKVGEWVSIARRKGTDWFVGTITNWTGRDVNLHLSFLSPGEYTAEIYSDAPDVDENPNHLTQQKISVTNSDTLHVHLGAGGGQVIRLTKR